MHRKWLKIQLKHGYIFHMNCGGMLLFDNIMGYDFVALFIWKYGLYIIITYVMIDSF
jgi:hypothetical protein